VWAGKWGKKGVRKKIKSAAFWAGRGKKKIVRSPQNANAWVYESRGEKAKIVVETPEGV